MPSQSARRYFDLQLFRCRLRSVTLWATACLVAGGVAAQAPEFRINSYTTGIQERPHIATFSDGSFVVAWQSTRSPGDDTSNTSILARRFDSSASPLGEDFQVNTETAYRQSIGLVEPLANDGFVIVWNIANTPLRRGEHSQFRGETGDIRGQLFDSSGNPVGTEFQVNALNNPVTNYGHEIAAHDQGGFAVVWDDFDDEIFFRPYDSLGNALSEPILLHTGSSCFFTSTIATAAGSVYVPGWRCRDESNDFRYQRFDSSGTPLGDEQVAPEPVEFGKMTSTDDGFLLAYDTGDPNWSGQLFDSAGSPNGSAFELSREVQYVTSGTNGFATVWYDNVPAGSDTDRNSIKMGRFSETGVLTAETQVNIFTTHNQFAPDVAALPDGRFVVVWSSYLSADEDEVWSIRARILSDDLFEDNFEDGTTNAWTLVVP